MPQNILLIQDDTTDARSVREALTGAGDGPFQVEWIRRCAEGEARLAREAQQDKRGTDGLAAVLVDLFLPDSQGLETFNRLFSAAPHIPILVLSAPENEEIAKVAVQQGAQDYLLISRLDSYSLPKILGSMVERAAIAEALFEEKERAQVTLNSIGDAILCTDLRGAVTYLNVVAERMTGWPWAEAVGRPLEEVLRLIDATTREAAQNPMAAAIRDDKTRALAQNSTLVRRDGAEFPIEDSAAPIHDRRGRVTGAVLVFRDVSIERAMALRMTYLARHDSLTDLPNRALLNDRLSQAMVLAQRHAKKMALLFLDVDHFKHINDTLGHAVGDRLLQSIAQRLRASVRNSDTVSRQGGDEFVILLADLTRIEDVAVSADKIMLSLRAPHHIDPHDLHVTVSMGIVIYPDDGTEAETLMKHADFAMYHAKDRGRDNYQFFRPDMSARAVARQSLENDLRRAQERREFVLHYQPVVGLQTGAIIGAEALIRWRHPRRGLMLAAQFIPVAEECGFIVAIGQWALREACHQARLWRDAGQPPLRIAINISTVELRTEGFVAGVQAILAETGLEPHLLELELTETFLMQDSETTAVVLQALKTLGVQLALDDFGTGYSSLSHLRRFPIDTLKIDQSFVRNVTTNADDAGIVSAVVSMGKSLGMRVVAEGVETREQVAFFQAQRCTEAQGHYFSPAMDAGDFTRLLEPNAAGKRVAA
jgi:diguanylate cyclase (GGDEF)-like protein/PAS domain S-box-containing protein